MRLAEEVCGVFWKPQSAYQVGDDEVVVQDSRAEFVLTH